MGGLSRSSQGKLIVADTYSLEELVKLVNSTGESDRVEFKAPVIWDGKDNSASLAKDIVAFANSRDGGAIVIGKSQSNGRFELIGLTPEEAKSFDTTRVAEWVNSKFSPPINLTCHPVEFADKHYIVITIPEFADIPSICVRAVGPSDGTPKPLLNKREIYIRTANAASAPLESAEDFRALVGLAVRKRRDEMLTAFHAMMQGKPLVAPPNDDELFANHFERVKADVQHPIAAGLAKGGWRMSFRPSIFRPERIPETAQLEGIIDKHSVRLRDEFPPHKRGTTLFNWGVRNSLYGECWGFSRAGLFFWCEEFTENECAYRSPWGPLGGNPHPEIPAGQWINFHTNLFKVIEFFTFMSRMVAVYDPAESLSFRVTAGPLTGRILATTNPNISLDARYGEPAGEGMFVWERMIAIQDFLATWKDECAALTKRFFEMFPGHEITTNTLREWVDKFLARDFSL
jgi:hypothetical protein